MDLDEVSWASKFLLMSPVLHVLKSGEEALNSYEYHFVWPSLYLFECPSIKNISSDLSWFI